jgi:hypothetical protein
MLARRILAVLALAASLVVGTPFRAQAQQQGGGGGFVMPDLSPEEAAQVEQMQAIGQQIFQNIQDSGIDMQQMMQDMAQQYQNGTFDPEAMQQMLIDKGIITQDMMNSMQSSARKLGLASVRRQMNCTDEEWAIIETKIARVIAALGDTNLNKQSGGANMGGVGSRMLSAPAQNTVAAKAFRDLKAVLREPNSSDTMIITRLQAWRDAYAKAQVELAAAQEDLVKILTLRQEAVLITIGVL